MLRKLAIILTLLHSSIALNDLSELCRDHNDGNGTMIANPYDCQSFIVCDEVAELHMCMDGLAYDATKQVCNLPQLVNCRIQQNSTKRGLLASSEMLPQFIAIDTDTGKLTNPLHKFDPEHIECRHFGAYFLPHPRHCRQYYLCAYGHLHQHHCGNGTYWNYEKEECQIELKDAHCFGKSTLGKTDDVTVPMPGTSNAFEATICYPMYTTSVVGVDGGSVSDFNPNSISGKPLASQSMSTAHPTTIVSSLSPSSLSSSSLSVPMVVQTSPRPISSSQQPPTAAATITTTITTPSIVKTSSSHVTTSATATAMYPSSTPLIIKPPTTTATLLVNSIKEMESTPRTVPNCPMDRQMYLPHSEECNKYYICILGHPVLTSCPSGLLWDRRTEFCDLAENVDCK